MNRVEEYLARTVKQGECLIWIGPRNKKGYANITKGLAHRYIAEHTQNQSVKGKVVMHTCDNPSCINPSHLIIGTQKQNMHDMIAKGRYVLGAKRKLTDEQIAIIVSDHRQSRKIAPEYNVDQRTISRIKQKHRAMIAP